jgi:hypothetical protein
MYRVAVSRAWRKEGTRGLCLGLWKTIFRFLPKRAEPDGFDGVGCPYS